LTIAELSVTSAAGNGVTDCLAKAAGKKANGKRESLCHVSPSIREFQLALKMESTVTFEHDEGLD